MYLLRKKSNYMIDLHVHPWWKFRTGNVCEEIGLTVQCKNLFWSYKKSVNGSLLSSILHLHVLFCACPLTPPRPPALLFSNSQLFQNKRMFCHTMYFSIVFFWTTLSFIHLSLHKYWEIIMFFGWLQTVIKHDPLT